jgi:ABC-type Na+ efflux pump permease subunit
MTFLPIVERELRVAARQPATYRARPKAALASLILLAPALVFLAGGGAPGRAGAFSVVSHLLFLYCLFAGAYATADCLSVEKRDGTLGLLFLTDLRGMDIVLGKLLSNGARLFQGLLAVVPVLAIPVLEGGLQAGDFWRGVLALFNALFCSCAVGLLFSALCRQGRLSLNLSTLVMGWFWLGGPLVGQLGSRLEWPGWLTALVESASPMVAQANAASPGAGSPAFWRSVLITQVVAWMFLGLAARILPNAWQDKPPGRRSLRWRDRWKQWTLGRPEARRRYRARLLDQNPFYWLAARHRWEVVWPFVFLAALGAGGFWLWRLANDPMGVLVCMILVLVVAHSVFKLSFTGTAVATIAAERRGGTLELLLSTPLGVEEILQGQWLALRRRYAAPIVVLLLAQLGLLVAMIGYRDVLGLQQSMAEWRAVALATMFMLVADLVTLGWRGMWLAISARQINQAAGTAAGNVLLVPWLGFLAVIAMLGMAATFGNWNWDPDFWFFFALWFLLGVVHDGWCAFRARKQLLEQFRTLAARQYTGEPARGFWSWLGRRAGWHGARAASSPDPI